MLPPSSGTCTPIYEGLPPCVIVTSDLMGIDSTTNDGATYARHIRKKGNRSLVGWHPLACPPPKSQRQQPMCLWRTHLQPVWFLLFQTVAILVLLIGLMFLETSLQTDLFGFASTIRPISTGQWSHFVLIMLLPLYRAGSHSVLFNDLFLGSK